MPEKKQIISAKEAAGHASKYLADVKSIASYNIGLEEIELSEDKKYWLITLSHPKGYIGSVMDYKIFKVDAYTGKVLSMKIRK